MDLRIKRTRKNIQAAFLELGQKKLIEKITVKEIAELAEINKSTFYLHFQDIFALFQEIENNFIQSTVEKMDYAELLFTEPEIFLKKLMDSFFDHRDFPLMMRRSKENSRNYYAISNKVQETLVDKIYQSTPALSRTAESDTVLYFIFTGIFHSYDTDDTYPFSEKKMSVIAQIISSVINGSDCFESIRN